MPTVFPRKRPRKIASGRPKSISAETSPKETPALTKAKRGRMK